MASDKEKEKKLPSLRNRGKKRSEDLSNFVFGKVQPQAVPLEEAVLGAIMLDKEALTIVIDIIRAESFYVDAHQLIYKAMLRLFEKSQPVDLLTVTEELKKGGDLEAVGGPFYLVELTNKVASAANIEYHSRLIAQKFVQRELIRVSTKIIRDAFEDTTDVFQLLDDAEQGLFSIAQQNMSRGFESMSSLAAKAQKQMEELKQKEDGLTGVPTGFTDFDRLTSGLQRSDLIIIAARPGMGKTALTLSLAKNAAMTFKKPVAFFSLEMSALQLAQRVIAMEAEISGMKMRNGQLEEYEWEQLNAALERVSEVPIYIDDTPGINVFELRAKCRRMKMQHDIDLVIIDYLQLMSGGGDNQKGNREQEVSAISRALKGLAKELNVPVIALSQLSRAVETRGGTKRPQLSDLRESGCLTGDAKLQDAITGAIYTIKELADRKEQTPVQVLAMGEDLKIGPHKLTKAFYSGKKMTYRLTTRSGRTIKASANHPFRKLEGWKALEELKVGDRIAVNRNINIKSPASPMSDDELILLAHLLGDGCILPKQPYHYTSNDEHNIEVVGNKAKSLFNISPRVVKQKNWWHTYLPSPYRLTHNTTHPITKWYNQLDIERVRSFKKRIPQKVFQCTPDQIALFLKHLWATDGNISWKILRGRKPSAAIYYATSSYKLARQVQDLLLYLNILSTIRKVGQGEYRSNYHVHVQGSTNQLIFLKEVGCYGKRGDIIPKLTAALNDLTPNINYDIIPKEAWKLFVQEALGENQMSWRELFRQQGLQYSSSIYRNGISRERMQRLNSILKSPTLSELSNSDLLWDEITSIVPLQEEDVYDATVEGVHNFVANNIVVHNSIEQDADIVSASSTAQNTMTSLKMKKGCHSRE
jgi:replicative DNA helicase